MSGHGTLGDRLARARMTVAVAESCTGGLLGARLTAEEGASRYFVAGITTYSNDAKVALLGVPAEDLAAHGAVSEPVARAMAAGARGLTGASAAVAITGVAGPGGGSSDKPVGTVWIAAAAEGADRAERFWFQGDRTAIREAAVGEALRMIEALLPPEV